MMMCITIACGCSTRPHYIKCIKPNGAKKPQLLEAALVMQQLRYSGVLEVVRIRREGFPIRVRFLDFYRNYEIFATGKPKEQFPGPARCRSMEQARRCCQLIASWALQAEQYQVGHSLVFLRDDGLELLDAAIKSYLGKRTAKLQAKYRQLVVSRRFKKQRQYAIMCQAFLRMFVQAQQVHAHAPRSRHDPVGRRRQATTRAVRRAVPGDAARAAGGCCHRPAAPGSRHAGPEAVPTTLRSVRGALHSRRHQAAGSRAGDTSAAAVGTPKKRSSVYPTVCFQVHAAPAAAALLPQGQKVHGAGAGGGPHVSVLQTLP